MFSILLVLLIIVAVLMTGLILLQKSEGSGMSGSSAASMFGGVLTGSAAGNFLTRLTAILATIFFILCAALSLVVAKTDVGNTDKSEIHTELAPQPAPKEEVKEENPAEKIDVAAELEKLKTNNK